MTDLEFREFCQIDGLGKEIGEMTINKIKNILIDKMIKLSFD